ncbi:hypothetical protein FACS1894163_07320 [Spirochaetia bacterium]|nr:hypothetical protein FACS1894163_07320 [Spirochaetia bacterium]
MITSRINAPDFPAPKSSVTSGSADSSEARPPGQVKSAGGSDSAGVREVRSSEADVKTGSLNQTRLSSLLLRMGLPQDKLSASIIAFVRYFSLPLNPALLAKIRRQSLGAEAGNALPAHSPGKGQAPAAGARSPQSDLRILQVREALSLAAAVAADKGVELSRDGLADYARSLSEPLTLDPDQGRSAGDGRGEGSPDKGRNQDENPEDAESLRNKILQAEDQNPLLKLMNRLPGKNGQRWMVFPFSFEDQGRSFAVTLRILLTPEGGAERMALEAVSEDRRWLFIADKPPNGRLQITGSFWPGGSPSEGGLLRRMEKELADLLGISPEQVQLRNDEEFPLFAPDSRAEALLSVNEEI